MFKWIKRKLGILSLAMARVEQSSLKQNSTALGSDGALEQTYHQGMLADALLKGEITMEVKELRWRLYKVLKEADTVKSKIIGYDEDNLPIVESFKVSSKNTLKKVKVDEFDDYEVEMIVNNDEIPKSTLEVLNIDDYDPYVGEANDILSLGPEMKNHDTPDSDTLEEATINRIKFDDMMSLLTNKKAIYIHRELRPKFEIEAYTNKMVVRKINNKQRLLEFYISKYPDVYDRKTRFLLSEIKKCITNPRSSNILDINSVGFISEKTLGTDNGLEYQYDIVSFDKIVEFNGHYVIKFICDVVVNGENVYDKYKLEDLEIKYQNKAPKKKT